ncbi:MAG TPA: hypothetical protein VM840_11255, partial [Actinomycetota bacterium]|nr:hypothetical protein [Actinomycetota bacterium]
ALAVALTAVAVSGCTGLARRAPTPEPGSNEVGSGVEVPVDATAEPVVEPEATEPPPAAEPEPAFVITLVDQNGRNPSGVPVVVDGPAPQTATSDDRGRVRVAGPVGDYRFQVRVGCTDSILVTYGASGNGRIVPGRVTEGTMRADWQHRHAPIPPVFSSTGPGWPVGQTVDLRFGVGDRCRDGDRAPRAAFGTFRLQPGANLSVVGEPVLRADDGGYATVRISCTRAGPAELALIDSRNPADTFDLVANERSFGSRPSCSG